MFQHRSHHAGRAFRPQRQCITIHAVGERVHLFFDNVGNFTETARKQSRRLNYRRAYLLIAVAAQHGLNRVFEELPQGRVLRQDIVHAFDANDFFSFFRVCHNVSLRNQARWPETLLQCAHRAR